MRRGLKQAWPLPAGHRSAWSSRAAESGDGGCSGSRAAPSGERQAASADALQHWRSGHGGVWDGAGCGAGAGGGGAPGAHLLHRDPPI